MLISTMSLNLFLLDRISLSAWISPFPSLPLFWNCITLLPPLLCRHPLIFILPLLLDFWAVIPPSLSFWTLSLALPTPPSSGSLPFQTRLLSSHHYQLMKPPLIVILLRPSLIFPQFYHFLSCFEYPACITQSPPLWMVNSPSRVAFRVVLKFPLTLNHTLLLPLTI